MKKLFLTLIVILLLVTSGAAVATETLTAPSLQTALVEKDLAPVECAILMARVDAQHQALKKDLHRIHRELAALKAAQNEPGITAVIGGIGWIIGLFGMAAYISSRRKGE